MNSESDRELFLSLLSPGPGDKILDVGAGKGLVAKRVLAASRGGEVYAIDPDERRVASMKRNSPKLRELRSWFRELTFS